MERWLVELCVSDSGFLIVCLSVSVCDAFVRALALRSITSVRVESMAESMVEPIRIALHDTDPFVRKTAALGVAKLFSLSPEAAQMGELLPTLANLLGDANSHVVANAATSLSEIQQRAPFSVFDLKMTTVSKILAALNESTEWNQVALLDVLVKYNPTSEKEAITILGRE